MTITLERDHAYYVLRAKHGPQSLGAAWPAGAVLDYQTDRFAVINEDRTFRVLKHVPLGDVLTDAHAVTESGQSKRTSVARVVGKYGDANLYQAVQTFVHPEYKSPIETAAKRDLRRMEGAFTVKQATEAGQPLYIEGMASTANLDRDNDIVKPDAFKASIEAFLVNPQLLLNHDMWGVGIGLVEELDFQDKGLWIRARVIDEQARKWIEEGRLRMFSVSFIVEPGGQEYQQAQFSDEGDLISPSIRTITKAELIEISVVTVPSNRQARFEIVKSLGGQSAKAINACSGDCANCTLIDGYCHGDLPEYVLEHKACPTYEPGQGWVLDEKLITERFGREAWLACHTFDTKSGPVLPHSALTRGRLVTVPALVRLSMAQIVARDHDMTDAQRGACWVSLAKRWQQCFPDESVPQIDKHGAPGEFKRISGLESWDCEPSGDGPEMRAHFAARGFTPSDKRRGSRWLASSDGAALYAKAEKSPACRQEGETTKECVARKIPELVGEGMEQDQATAVAYELCGTACSEKTKQEPKDKSEDKMSEDQMRALIKEELDKRSTEAPKQDTSGDEADEPEQDAPVEVSDTVQVGISPASHRTLEEALAGQPVSGEALASAVADCEEALNAEVEIELETASE